MNERAQKIGEWVAGLQQQKILIGKWVAGLSLVVALVALALKSADFFIPSVQAFYQGHPDFGGFIKWVLAISSILSVVSKVLTSWWEMEPTRKILKEAIVQWATARTSATSFEIINPADPSVFNDCFGSAVWILAYNPPLTLLEKSKDHRNVIYANLINSKFVYKMIVSRKGAGRICVVLDRWREEHGNHIEEYSNKISVINYDHEADLHTMITDWGVLRADLRGLSFFVIKHQDGKRTALLYLLGKPFVETFDVPDQAIRITGNSNEMYAHLKELFWKRWNGLNTCDNPDYAEKSLTHFYENIKKKNSTP